MQENQFKNFMEQAQNMAQNLQGDLATKVCEGHAGGGLVEAKVNGLNQLISLKIDPSIIDPNDPNLLEDLVRASVNQAYSNLKELLTDEVKKKTGGLNIPNLF